MTTALFQRNEPSISRDIEKKCQICSKEFSVFKREHQCKRCFRAVCSDCGEHKIMVFKFGFTRRPHRGCKLCFDQIKEFADYINSNQLQFGKMSNIGNKWIRRIQKKPYMHSIDKNKYKKFTKEVFDRMWDSYHYSMRQFIGIMTFDFEQEGIYKVVSDVFTIVISACPDEDFESIAYLVMFMLCFCSADKASLICLYLIQLKSYVKDELGLINSYFKILALSEEMNVLTKEYLRLKSKSFISGFSINVLDIKCSISIIDKIITRKKIDEIYIYLCLSIDAIKESFVKSMDNINYCDLMLIRTCSTEALSSKYKLTSTLRTNSFIPEKPELLQDKNQSVIYQQSKEKYSNNRSQSNLMTASFSEGIRSNNQQFSKNQSFLEKEDFRNLEEVKPFRKKMDLQQDDLEFNQDSFSMISIINEMKETSAPVNYSSSRENEGQQLLTLLNQSDLSPNNSVEITKPTAYTKQNHLKTGNENGESILKDKLQLQKMRRQNKSLKEEINALRNANSLLKQELNALKTGREKTVGKESGPWEAQKKQFETQITYLKTNLGETLSKLREQDSVLVRYEELKKSYKKLQGEVKSFQQQNEELQSNSKMFKNKIQSLSLTSHQQFDRLNDNKHNKQSEEPNKMTESLKITVRDKNQQIQELSKKNKLLNYQIQQISRQKQEDKEKMELVSKLTKAERQRAEIMGKMEELSNVLMAMQQQKLDLSEQVFVLKERMRGKGLSID